MDDCLERKFHCVISRLSVIQEADTGPTINILEATPGSAKSVSPTSNNLSNYFGTPQTSGAGAGDSIFDQLTFPRSGPDQVVEAGGFTDISINTKRASNISPSHLKIFKNTPKHPQTQPPFVWRNNLVQLNLFAC